MVERLAADKIWAARSERQWCRMYMESISLAKTYDFVLKTFHSVGCLNRSWLFIVTSIHALAKESERGCGMSSNATENWHVFIATWFLVHVFAQMELNGGFFVDDVRCKGVCAHASTTKHSTSCAHTHIRKFSMINKPKTGKIIWSETMGNGTCSLHTQCMRFSAAFKRTHIFVDWVLRVHRACRTVKSNTIAVARMILRISLCSALDSSLIRWSDFHAFSFLNFIAPLPVFHFFIIFSPRIP